MSHTRWKRVLREVAIDSIHSMKVALHRGIAGILHVPSSYFMKPPPVQFTDDVCYQMMEDFIAGKEIVVNSMEAVCRD